MLTRNGVHRLLMRKQSTGSTKAHGNFIGDPVDLVLITQATHGHQILGVVHGHACSPLHQGLEDEGCGLFVVLSQIRLQRLHGCVNAHLGWRRQGRTQAQQRRVGLTKQINVGNRQRPHGFTVITTLQAHKLVLLRQPAIAPTVHAHLQSDLGSAGPIAGVKRMTQTRQR